MSDPKEFPAPNNDANSPATAATSDGLLDHPVSPKRTIDKIPRDFGRYRLQDCLGRGGMGAVFKAHDNQLDRQVALKIPFLGDNDEETRARFYREARAAAMLQHAYICPVFDVGDHQGIPYLTMAFIEGRSLAQALKAGVTYTPTQAALLVRKIALGMQEAHSKGVVHRDLKPANILLRPNGEPVIMDFGLARRADDKRSHGLTQEGDIIGTLDYMSPEQVEGNNTAVGPPADVYSLGLMLYELLCGRRPFEGTTTSLLVQIATKEAPKPSEFKADIPAKIEDICLKSIAKQPDDRYPTMIAFAAALAEYLRNPQANAAAAKPPSTATIVKQPSSASAETVVTAARTGEVADTPRLPVRKSSPRGSGRSSARRSGRKKKQNNSMMPLLLVGGGGLALLAIVAVVVIILAFGNRDKQPENAILNQSDGPANSPPVPPNRPNNPPQGSGGAPPNAPNRPTNTPPNLNPNTPPNPNPNRPRASGDAAGFSLRLPTENVSLVVGQSQAVNVKVDRKEYPGPITFRFSGPKELRVSPTGPINLQGNQTEFTLNVRVLEAPATPTLILEIRGTHDVEPNRHAVSVNLSVRAQAGSCLRVIELPIKGNYVPEAMAFSPDASIVLIGGAGRTEANRGGGPPPPPPGGGPPPPPPGGGPPPPPPGGGPPPPGGGDPTTEHAIQIFSLDRVEAIGTLTGHRDKVAGLVVSADGKTALSISHDDTIAVWNLAQGQKRSQSPAPRARQLAIDPEAKRGLIAFAGADPDARRGIPAQPGLALRVNLDTMKPTGTPINTSQLMGVGLADAVRAVAWSSDRRALIGGLDGKLALLEFPDKGKVPAPRHLVDHSEAILAAVFADDGVLAATGGGGVLQAGKLQPGRDTAVRVWNVADHQLKWKGEGHTDSVVCLAFAPNRAMLASASADGMIKIWNAETGAELASFTGHVGKVLAIGFSADGKSVWSAGVDKTARHWRLP